MRARWALRRSKTSESSIASQSAISGDADDQRLGCNPSPLLNLPLPVRERIYSHVYGDGGPVVHVLMKRGSGNANSKQSKRLAYRRCPVQRHLEDNDDCAMKNCRRFLDSASGCYFGSFDRGISALLFTCRQMYVHILTLPMTRPFSLSHKQCCLTYAFFESNELTTATLLRSRNTEATTFLYENHTFDFDHPLTFRLFTQSIPPTSLSSIRRISFEPQRDLYTCRLGSNVPNSVCPFEAWNDMWRTLASMSELEEVRIRVRPPLSSASIAPREMEALDEARDIVGDVVGEFRFEVPWAVLAEPA